MYTVHKDETYRIQIYFCAMHIVNGYKNTELFELNAEQDCSNSV